MAGEEPGAAENRIDDDSSDAADNECTRWVYNHLRFTLERDDRAYESFVSKSRQMMATVVGSYAALSFALTKSEWTAGSCHSVGFGVVAGFAGLCLAIAFVAGCFCVQIKRGAVVGVNQISEALGEGPIPPMQSPEVYRGLTDNVARAITDNRRLRNAQQCRGWVLNIFTLIGVALTILAVFYAVVGDTISSNADALTESEAPTDVRFIEANQSEFWEFKAKAHERVVGIRPIGPTSFAETVGV